MKKLDIKLLEKGRIINVLSEEVYDSENETLDVVIDYSNTEYNSWDKRCDIIVANGQKSIKLSDTFSLGREYLVQGVLQLQPIAFSGDNVVKFPITSIVVSESLNVLENDTTVTLSIAQEMLNDIELFKIGVNGELVSQNIKIDGLLLDTDTRLSEQDGIIADLTSKLEQSRTELDVLNAMNNDKTWARFNVQAEIGE